MPLVCNNAGVGGAALPAWEMPPEAWDWMINVNLYGVIHGIRSFVPLLVAQNEGHVVNTTSIAGVVTGVGSSPYTATKHAVTALTESLQNELEVVGAEVGVSLLVPGRIDTADLGGAAELARALRLAAGGAPGGEPGTHADPTGVREDVHRAHGSGRRRRARTRTRSSPTASGS